MGHIRTARDWRGTKYQLSLCSVDELRTMLDNAFDSADQITRFVEQVQAELIERGEIPTEPPNVA